MIESLKSCKVLVTGGAGFIGSNLVDKLSIENSVIVLDDLSTGSLSNLEESKNRITFVKGSVLDKALLKSLVNKVQYVFHLAACVGNLKSIEDPLFDMEVNVRGTLNVLQACIQSGIKRMVYSSSASVFGEARYLPIDEEHPLDPESPYGVSKLAAERYCIAFQKVYGLPTVALRYFNVYGPRQGGSAYPNVIAVFFRKIKEGESLTVFGDGTQTRDFVFVGDIVRANIMAATHPAAIGQVFNIASGRENSVNHLVDLIPKITGHSGDVVHAEPRVGEVLRSLASIAKVQKTLGYEPATDLEKGLRLTWKRDSATTES
jgi:UDP-glucose 4-epimerase